MNKWSRFKFTPNLPLGANGERVTGSKAHIELSKEAAKEGMVLLKNEQHVLPLQTGAKVALFGKATFDYVKGGGGSGDGRGVIHSSSGKNTESLSACLGKTENGAKHRKK